MIFYDCKDNCKLDKFILFELDEQCCMCKLYESENQDEVLEEMFLVSDLVLFFILVKLLK